MISPLSAESVRRSYPVDRAGYIKLAMNALLVIRHYRAILLDPGCADFLPRRLAIQYGLEMERSLEDELAERGIMPGDITDVMFTHLHFDHGSGAFRRVPGRIVKRFPLARYLVLKEHYEYALQPDSSEADAFFTRFFHFTGPPDWLEDWQEDWITYKIFNGHTRGMVVPIIRLNGSTTCYLTDLVPMALFMGNEIYSGYDLHAETALHEKQEFLKEIKDPVKLIFFHDLLNASIIYP
jgi:glyoxylase-like metal-dependent hydrolase (beta-lactamase superfamily II)